MAPFSCLLVGATLVVGAFADLVLELRSQTAGQVLVPTDPTFEATRKVMNAACKAEPVVIVVPKTERDISTILKTAAKYKMEISVRSGGHSYTCTNIKEGGVHIDMRQFDTKWRSAFAVEVTLIPAPTSRREGFILTCASLILWRCYTLLLAQQEKQCG